MRKVLFIALVAILGGLLFAGGATEEGEWARTVDVVVPVKAGGGTDLAARAIFDKVAKIADKSIGIINNDSGNCVVAFEEVRNSDPDGSKILYFNTGFLTRVAAGIYNHTIDEFKVIGVSHGVEPAYALLVSAESGITDIEQLKEKAKAAPGSMLFGCNVGGTTEIMGRQLADSMGVEFKYVHSGSDTGTLTELIGKSIDVCYANVNQARQYVESGRAVALGVLGQTDEPDRCSILPDIPNLIELGYDVYFGVYMVILGPASMPDELARKIYDYCVEAYADPDVVELLKPAALDGVFVPYDEAASLLAETQEVYNEAFN